MGVKLAASMGAEVTVFSTSPNKEADAKKLGAKHFVISKDENAMKAITGTLDFIVDTVSTNHDVMSLVNALTDRGVLVLVGTSSYQVFFWFEGVPTSPIPVHAIPLLMGEKVVTGSKIGSIKMTQEMIDYCAEHDIVPEVEVISADKIDEA